MADTREVEKWTLLHGELVQEDDGPLVWSEDYDTLADKLAEVEVERDKFHLLWKDACVRSGKNSLRADAAEAAFPAVYRLAAKDHAKWLRKQAGEKGGTKTPQGRTAQFYARKIGETPTPTAAELMARIGTLDEPLHRHTWNPPTNFGSKE